MSKRRPFATSKQWASDKSQRDLHDHFHALGVLQVRWNVAELQLQQMCWFLLGAGPSVGRAVTNDMGNVSRTNLIITLAREVIKEPTVLAFFQGVEKLFNAHRDNRNFITHCRVMSVLNAPGQGMAVFQQFKAAGKFKHLMYLMPIEALREVADGVATMNVFFSQFLTFLTEAASDPTGSIERLPSLGMPSLPQSLAQGLQSFDPALLGPSPPSPGKRKPDRAGSGGGVS